MNDFMIRPIQAADDAVMAQIIRIVMPEFGAGGDGNFNLGRFSDPQQDALIERIRKETDLPTRNALIEKALLAEHEFISHIPLHNQIIPWAMKKTVELPHRADNLIEWRALKVN